MYNIYIRSRPDTDPQLQVAPSSTSIGIGIGIGMLFLQRGFIFIKFEMKNAYVLLTTLKVQPRLLSAASWHIVHPKP